MISKFDLGRLPWNELYRDYISVVTRISVYYFTNSKERQTISRIISSFFNYELWCALVLFSLLELLA